VGVPKVTGQQFADFGAEEKRGGVSLFRTEVKSPLKKVATNQQRDGWASSRKTVIVMGTTKVRLLLTNGKKK